MTVEELQTRCDYWTERLSLGEWRGRVKVLLKTPKFLLKTTGYESVGACWWSAEECRAEIYLRKGEGESTLLHELVHLVLQGHTTYKDGDEMLERAINRLAAALLEGRLD